MEYTFSTMMQRETFMFIYIPDKWDSILLRVAQYGRHHGAGNLSSQFYNQVPEVLTNKPPIDMGYVWCAVIVKRVGM